MKLTKGPQKKKEVTKTTDTTSGLTIEHAVLDGDKVAEEDDEEEVPCERLGHAMVCTRDGVVWMFGGMRGEEVLNDLWTFDTSKESGSACLEVNYYVVAANPYRKISRN